MWGTEISNNIMPVFWSGQPMEPVVTAVINTGNKCAEKFIKDWVYHLKDYAYHLRK